ncbi:unnamed protein product (macronuclear) [Paramecium tetraurelia]|uniref:Uncharacterized protein n=1 Tax=Paramecium tetraurelia TaxID=5888 RepID=A0CQM1_PARTE|nr:uncharacterized protein GSPATT00009436001 [Paramecium tetraurelia]CAK73088.1 unnamed protein product [Paramecium tetraurelia]|eukprot:XP_001440485.1 hypothetical protein (macronuclear) [Paramecium tetraurelia strain d4-2]
MKKISRTHKIEQDLKSKMNSQTESLFNKIQKKLDDKEEILSKHVEPQIQNPKEIDITKQRDLLKKKSFKQSPNSVQYRIKTDVSSYYFANQQKKPIFYLPNLSNLENLKKNSLSIFESKTPRMLIRSEKYNLKQPLTQRLLATYLKKSNSKLLNNKKQ